MVCCWASNSFLTRRLGIERLKYLQYLDLRRNSIASAADLLPIQTLPSLNQLLLEVWCAMCPCVHLKPTGQPHRNEPRLPPRRVEELCRYAGVPVPHPIMHAAVPEALYIDGKHPTAKELRRIQAK